MFFGCMIDVELAGGDRLVDFEVWFGWFLVLDRRLGAEWVNWVLWDEGLALLCEYLVLRGERLVLEGNLAGGGVSGRGVEGGAPVDVGVSLADAVDHVEKVLRVHGQDMRCCEHAPVKIKIRLEDFHSSPLLML